VPDWLVFILFSVAWSPLLVLLHETGHALAALALTDGEVSISMRGAGVLGGSVSYDPASLRHARGEAWIAAAGPAVTLFAAAVLWLAWLSSGSNSATTLVAAGALVATLHFVTSALPLRYGAGLGGPDDTDGRVIWRVLTGAPPGGIERDLRRLGEPERAAHPLFLVVLVLIVVLSFVMDPLLGLGLVGMFGAAALLQRGDARR
jgi:hypothetical protein